MKRPSFQFYPADWRSSANLRRCSDAARGVWMDLLCVLHDSDEYGVSRWPLADLIRAAGIPMRLAKELIDKGVLKGSDTEAFTYIFTPRHAGKDGEPATLITNEKNKSCWYSSRLVRDEWIRQRRGSSTQFTPENQPPKPAPKPAPNPTIGERQGDGPSSASAFASISKSNPLSSSQANVDIESEGVTLKNGKQKYKDAATRVLEFLNTKTGRHYRPTKVNLTFIAERMAEGASEIECRQVIARQIMDWESKPEMQEYLRPSTLFNATKFSQYIGKLGT